ncbi:MAG: GNAT family N-acetyltransferase [Rhodobacterales bacterium]|nr:GNAT family N-acetyltransferase [Rhodobacterales bacterium]
MSPQSGLVVRSLREEDRAEWQHLWTGYLAYCETTVSAEIHDSTFTRLLGENARDFNAFVMVSDGQLVGLTHFIYHRHAWIIKDVCYLQHQYTAPKFRGTGIGQAMIVAVNTAADKRGAPSVYWLSQDFNAAGRHQCDRVGQLPPFIKHQRP